VLLQLCRQRLCRVMDSFLANQKPFLAAISFSLGIVATRGAWTPFTQRSHRRFINGARVWIISFDRIQFLTSSIARFCGRSDSFLFGMGNPAIFLSAVNKILIVRTIVPEPITHLRKVFFLLVRRLNFAHRQWDTS
jgi:hypothetical protein